MVKQTQTEFKLEASNDVSKDWQSKTKEFENEIDSLKLKLIKAHKD